MAVFTDCGTFNDEMIQALKDLDGILLESNYEIPMLECGPYPYPLKRRILGPMGHLSNDMAAEVLKAIYSPKLKLVVGGHLSGENNYPEVARLSLENAVKELGAEKQIRVEIAKRTEPTELFTLE